ncbi:hypothetical protein EVAR_83813_1 [Eumeta japonica]|uniref:Uncharacterized protein n=1 Tax=Eumeta variegata TaxID=151549 RepID=A0A4C1WIC2_EUMVA|nr:hypothetical protein EVAR_83813_1 [Eumeta japonica]
MLIATAGNTESNTCWVFLTTRTCKCRHGPHDPADSRVGPAAYSAYRYICPRGVRPSSAEPVRRSLKGPTATRRFRALV